MDTVEFLKKLKRMCDKNKNACCWECYACEIFAKKAEKAISCSSFIKEYPEEAIAIVKKWSAEHPEKTRQSEFLKMFPNADILNGIIRICPKKIDQNSVTSEECSEAICGNCQKKYWLAEVE